MSITPEDLAAIQRRQRIAEALMQQGQQPLETNQVAGGYVVPVSPLAGLSKIIQSMSGAYMGRKADERQADMMRQQQDEISNIDFNSPDAARQLIKSGQFDAGLKMLIEQQKEAKKVHREGIGTGFDPGEEAGTMVPKLIVTPDGRRIPYTDYQLELYAAKKQQLGPFDEEKMDMSRDDQFMQHQALALSQANAARAAAQAEQSNRIAREKFDYEQEKDKKVLENKPLTDAQAKNTFYLNQMNAASNTANSIENEGFNPTDIKKQAQLEAAGTFLNSMVPKDAQKYKQSQLQWADSYLRITTGAQAPINEVKNTAKTYFPTIGDNEETVRQKYEMRKEAENGVSIMAGKAAKLVTPRTVESGNLSRLEELRKKHGITQ